MKKQPKNAYIVSPTEGGWTVSSLARGATVHSTKEAALAVARSQLIDEGGVIVERRRGGDVSYVVIGQNRFAKFAAVEGISLSSKMKADLSDFERRGLNSNERRNEIVRKYGKVTS